MELVLKLADVFVLHEPEFFVKNRFVSCLDSAFFETCQFTDAFLDRGNVQSFGLRKLQNIFLLCPFMHSLHDESRFFVILHHIKRIANIREVLKSSNVNRLPGVCLVDLLTFVVHHELDFALVNARYEDVIKF